MNPRMQRDSEDSLRRQASEWLVRRDRGLSAQEAIDFELWLAADERHAMALRRSRSAWALLDRIPEELEHDITTRAARRRWTRNAIGWATLALAATVAIVLTPLVHREAPRNGAEATVAVAPEWISPQIRTLSDGTLVRLNAGADVRELFSIPERRVQLVRGEAHFTVAKNPARPFVVQAGTIEARAVGTAFNVNLQSAAVEILVTEGTVAVSERSAEQEVTSPPDPARPSASLSPSNEYATDGGPDTLARTSRLLLNAGQRAVVALAPVSTAATAVVTDLTQGEMNRALAWQEPLLRLSGATLADLAAEFQRRTGYRLILADPELASLRAGGRFRGDDVAGFVRLLEENFGIHSETTADGAIVLRRGPRVTRD